MTNRRINKKKLTEKATEMAEKVETAAKNAADKTEETVKAAADTIEAHMNKPEVKEAVDTITEAVKDTATSAAKEVKAAAGTTRSKVSDIILQDNGLDISIPAIEKAVKKQAAAKRQKGEITIYLNVAERVAYYTVNGAGGEDMRVAFDEA